MKKFVAMLPVLSMVTVLACTALAESKLVGNFVLFIADSNAYTAAKASKKTASVAEKGSVGYCEKVCGKYAKILVNQYEDMYTYAWFKKCDLKVTGIDYVSVFWAKGGKGMSSCMKDTITTIPGLKGIMLKVTGHTNLRKNPGLKFKSQGVVEKCDKLKSTGRVGLDTRGVLWYEICKSGKKLWVSGHFIEKTDQIKKLLGLDF